ncbi:MAG: hypothetical protein ABWX92_05740 [Mycetocola sp.]
MPAREVRRMHGEDGVSLILALGFLMAFGLLIPAILSLGTTNLAATSRLHEQRDTIYTADAATDGAIQYLRKFPNCGRPLQNSTTCPIIDGANSLTSTYSVNENGETATTKITCGNSVSSCAAQNVNRPLTLVTTDADGKTRVTSEVILRDGSTTTPIPVDVQKWTYSR